jgi:hypothetical protein
MKHQILIAVFFLLIAGVSSAGSDDFGNASDFPAAPDEILLKDGTILTGTIISESEDFVIFETTSLGRLEISRDRIAGLSGSEDTYGAVSDPDANSIMFCPTPETMEKGDGYFRNYELFFLNFGTSLSDDFDLSFGTMFPISGELVFISMGGKYRLLDRREQPVGLALIGSYTQIDDFSFHSFGAVAGVGDHHRSLNLAINRSTDDDGDSETIFILGGDYQAGRRSKFFVEYMSSASMFEDENDDLNGFINVGIRLFSATHSFSFSGFRPLAEDSGSFLAFPMLMYSKHW